ncbi:MAG TPA: hypothetical protein VF668_14535 [Pyrinomonadaceae bacterium]|jgi:hypothetical protein
MKSRTAGESLEHDTEQEGARRAVDDDDAGPAGGGGRAPDAAARPVRGRLLRGAACALFAAAAALLLAGRTEAAFLVAGLGASAWFLNVRAGLIRKHDLVKVGGRNWRPRDEVEAEEAAAREEEEEEEDEGAVR